MVSCGMLASVDVQCVTGEIGSEMLNEMHLNNHVVNFVFGNFESVFKSTTISDRNMNKYLLGYFC
jgi:hypothetical protein